MARIRVGEAASTGALLFRLTRAAHALFAWSALALIWMALAGCGNGRSLLPSIETVVFADPPVLEEATSIGSAPESEELTVVLGLVRDSEGLTKRVADMSTPGSPYYRTKQTIEQTAEEFGARRETIAAVVSDLASRGFTARPDVTRTFVATTMSVAQASALFATSFAQYNVADLGEFIAPETPPSAPIEWQGVVREVMGLSTQPGLYAPPDTPEDDALVESAAFTEVDQPGEQDASGTPSGCADALAAKGLKPNQLQTAYNVDALHAQGYYGQGISMALVEYGGFSSSDIDTFTSCYGIENAVAPTVVLTGSLDKPLGIGKEATLDIEVALSVAPQLDALYVFEQKKPKSLSERPIVYSAALDKSNTGGVQVQIVSTSLGVCEETLNETFIGMMEDIFKAAVAANVSLFASAGDSGSSTCYHHGKKNQEQSASYPATSQYTVGVGGTNLVLSLVNGLNGSSVWNDYPWNETYSAGGGGPSQLVPAPSWQAKTGTGASMRTTPDVAFFGDPLPGYTIYRSTHRPNWYTDGGTSAATPFFAAATALMHQAVIAARGGAPVPAYQWVYGLAADSTSNGLFYDITLGDNDLFGVGCCTAGPGYDQASGWGSLDLGGTSTWLINATHYQIAE